MLPTIQEYKDSFRNPSEYFKNLQLGFIPSKFDENDPYFIAGGFACVFKVQQQNEFWAFKCFLQEDPHRNERLKLLSDFLQNRTETYFLPTYYHTDELWVCSNLGGDAEYPTLAMKWVEGLTLGEYVHKAAKDKNTQKLTAIYEAFLRLAHFLLTNDFAHGDLKHDNILVDKDENLILIDYDGMYLPSLTAFPSPELGGHGYQHPKRTAQDWGRHIDDFSILVILLSLRAYILLPSLIDDHKNENLLLTSEDLQNPMQSKPLQTLWQQNDEPLKHLLGMLLNSLAQNNLRVLEIGAFVERNKMEKKFVFDMEWWNGLSEEWKEILRKNVEDEYGIVFLERNIEDSKNRIDFFEKINNLTFLSLYNQGIEQLPNWIGSLTKITQLEFLNNHLPLLPESIGNLIKLTQLSLDNNKLTSLPKNIGNLTELTKLYLRNNQFSYLPESIGNLRKLTHLFLEGNPLSNHEIEKIKELLPNCNIKNIFFDMKWWSGLSEEWKGIFRSNIRGNEDEIDFFEKIVTLTELDLSNQNLEELPYWICNLNELEKLNLENNKLSSLPKMIGNLIKLKNLRLGWNKLTSLPKSTKYLVKMEYLSLNSNQFTLFPEIIKSLIELETLYLGFNKITSLPTSIGNLDKLVDFSVFNNNLTSLPEEIGNLINLNALVLGDNQLKILPESIGNLNKLEHLDLVDNKFSFLPKSLKKINYLSRLRLANNRFTLFPKIICSLTNLESLDLSHNKLSSLPEDIVNLSNLSSLNLKSNEFDLVPTFVGNLTSLTYLNLGQNKLTLLPKTIVNLKNLTDLNLRDNYFNSYPEVINTLISLKSLNLANNKIESLPENLANLINLQYLDISKNQLTFLPKGLQNLTSLKSLDVRNNLSSINQYEEDIRKLLPNCKIF